MLVFQNGLRYVNIIQLYTLIGIIKKILELKDDNFINHMTRFIKWLSLNSRNCHTLSTCTVRNTGGKTTRKNSKYSIYNGI